MRSCAVIFIWRGVMRSEHETSILHTCRVYCELSISLFVEVGNKDSFVYYRKVICIMVFAYFIHEDTILPCATCAPFFMKGLRIWTQGWEKEPFSICVSSGYAYKTIWEWAQQREREREREGWQFDVTSLIFVPLASIVLPCIQCCITSTVSSGIHQ